MKPVKLSLMIFISITFLVSSTVMIARYLYWDSNDWPTLYRAIRDHCSEKSRCILDLTNVYDAIAWSNVIAFNDTGEREYKEKVMGRRFESYREFCQGLVFFDEQGDILKEEYSGCFEEFFALNRQVLVRFSFGDDNYFKVNRTNPSVCVIAHEQSGTNREFYGFDKKLRRYFYEIRQTCPE